MARRCAVFHIIRAENKPVLIRPRHGVGAARLARPGRRIRRIGRRGHNRRRPSLKRAVVPLGTRSVRRILMGRRHAVLHALDVQDRLFVVLPRNRVVDRRALDFECGRQGRAAPRMRQLVGRADRRRERKRAVRRFGCGIFERRRSRHGLADRRARTVRDRQDFVDRHLARVGQCVHIEGEAALRANVRGVACDETIDAVRAAGRDRISGRHRRRRQRIAVAERDVHAVRSPIRELVVHRHHVWRLQRAQTVLEHVPRDGERRRLAGRGERQRPCAAGRRLPGGVRERTRRGRRLLLRDRTAHELHRQQRVDRRPGGQLARIRPRIDIERDLRGRRACGREEPVGRIGTRARAARLDRDRQRRLRQVRSRPADEGIKFAHGCRQHDVRALAVVRRRILGRAAVEVVGDGVVDRHRGPGGCVGCRARHRRQHRRPSGKRIGVGGVRILRRVGIAGRQARRDSRRAENRLRVLLPGDLMVGEARNRELRCQCGTADGMGQLPVAVRRRRPAVCAGRGSRRHIRRRGRGRLANRRTRLIRERQNGRRIRDRARIRARVNIKRGAFFTRVHKPRRRRDKPVRPVRDRLDGIARRNRQARQRQSLAEREVDVIARIVRGLAARPEHIGDSGRALAHLEDVIRHREARRLTGRSVQRQRPRAAGCRLPVGSDVRRRARAGVGRADRAAARVDGGQVRELGGGRNRARIRARIHGECAAGFLAV